MKNKLRILAVFLVFTGLNTAAAEEGRADCLTYKDALSAVEYPQYVAIKFISPQGKDLVFSGLVEIPDGQMSVAKNLLIGTDEIIQIGQGESFNEDLGKANEMIKFNFATRGYKGFILRIIEGDNLKFYLNDNESGEVQISASTLPCLNFSKLLDNGGQMLIQSIPLDKGKGMAYRNNELRNKLAVSEKMLNVERWAAANLEMGRIDQNTYNLLSELTWSSWFNSYDNADVIYFNWRYQRLKNNINSDRVTPLHFYGGLRLLMEKIK